MIAEPTEVTEVTEKEEDHAPRAIAAPDLLGAKVK